jgi:hypothetical protein
VKEAMAKVEVQGENRLKHLFYRFTPAVVFHEPQQFEGETFRFLTIWNCSDRFIAESKTILLAKQPLGCYKFYRINENNKVAKQ